MAHKALSVLDPNGDWRYRLQPLLKEDIRGPTRTDDDKGEGRRELSWIWVMTSRVPLEGDKFDITEGIPYPLHILLNYYLCS